MQFLNMEPLTQAQPLVEVKSNGYSFDLHNDGELREIGYDYDAGVLRLAWSMRVPAWTVPDELNPDQRSVSAGVAMLFSDVRRLHASGEFVTPEERDGGGMDFFEYKPLQFGTGEVRFVLGGDAEVIVVASRCELLVVRNTSSELPAG